MGMLEKYNYEEVNWHTEKAYEIAKYQLANLSDSILH